MSNNTFFWRCFVCVYVACDGCSLASRHGAGQPGIAATQQGDALGREISVERDAGGCRGFAVFLRPSTVTITDSCRLSRHAAYKNIKNIRKIRQIRRIRDITRIRTTRRTRRIRRIRRTKIKTFSSYALTATGSCRSDGSDGTKLAPLSCIHLQPTVTAGQACQSIFQGLVILFSGSAVFQRPFTSQTAAELFLLSLIAHATRGCVGGHRLWGEAAQQICTRDAPSAFFFPLSSLSFASQYYLLHLYSNYISIVAPVCQSIASSSFRHCLMLHIVNLRPLPRLARLPRLNNLRYPSSTPIRNMTGAALLGGHRTKHKVTVVGSGNWFVHFGTGRVLPMLTSPGARPFPKSSPKMPSFTRTSLSPRCKCGCLRRMS